MQYEQLNLFDDVIHEVLSKDHFFTTGDYTFVRAHRIDSFNIDSNWVNDMTYVDSYDNVYKVFSDANNEDRLKEIKKMLFYRLGDDVYCVVHYIVNTAYGDNDIETVCHVRNF